MITPEPTTAMQALWDRAMLIARTRGAYGCSFPLPGTVFPLPTPGTMLHDILFVCTATEEEIDAHLAAVREDMIAWKAKVAASRGKSGRLLVRHEPVNISGLDLDKIEIDL